MRLLTCDIYVQIAPLQSAQINVGMHNRPTSGLGAGKSVFKYFGARILVFRPIKKKKKKSSKMSKIGPLYPEIWEKSGQKVVKLRFFEKISRNKTDTEKMMMTNIIGNFVA